MYNLKNSFIELNNWMWAQVIKKNSYISHVRVDEKLLFKILKIQESKQLAFTLHIENRKYQLQNVTIIKSSTPVKKLTSRGGVYFSDTFIFKLKGTIEELSIRPLLSNTMLGPNPEFRELEIKTKIMLENSLKDVTIFTNLTNLMESASNLELNFNIVRTNAE